MDILYTRKQLVNMFAKAFEEGTLTIEIRGKSQNEIKGTQKLFQAYLDGELVIDDSLTYTDCCTEIRKVIDQVFR